eukprot:GHVR01125045.1.p1 GENE.GHVR01125045.1~~GHVR01125045.1.p1  ORF type:complete len:126 (-),score=57.65 GHVR01125045.1:99-476(-)
MHTHDNTHKNPYTHTHDNTTHTYPYIHNTHTHTQDTHTHTHNTHEQPCLRRSARGTYLQPAPVVFSASASEEIAADNFRSYINFLNLCSPSKHTISVIDPTYNKKESSYSYTNTHTHTHTFKLKN